MQIQKQSLPIKYVFARYFSAKIMIKYENEPFKQHIFRFSDVNGSEFMARIIGNGYIIMEKEYLCLVKPQIMFSRSFRRI